MIHCGQLFSSNECTVVSSESGPCTTSQHIQVHPNFTVARSTSWSCYALKHTQVHPVHDSSWPKVHHGHLIHLKQNSGPPCHDSSWPVVCQQYTVTRSMSWSCCALKHTHVNPVLDTVLLQVVLQQSIETLHTHVHQRVYCCWLFASNAL